MPKHPTKPRMPTIEDPDPGPGSERHRTRQAFLAVERLSRQMDAHIAEDNEQLSALRGDVGEVRGEVKEARDDVAEVRGEVKSINTHVGNLRVDMVRVATAVEGMAATLDAQKEITHVKMIAEVETGKAEKIAVIEDDVDRKKAKRAFWLKVAVVVVTLIGAVAGALIEHFR